MIVDPQRLQTLIDAHFEGRLSAAERGDLEAILADNDEACLHFWREAEWNADIRTAAEALAARLEQKDHAPAGAGFLGWFNPRIAFPALSIFVRHARVFSWVTAAVVVGIAVGAMTLMFMPKPRDQARQNDFAQLPASGERENPAAARLARLHEAEWGAAADDGQVADPAKYLTPETLKNQPDLFPGDRLYLKRGLAEIHFSNGARVVLEGPARLKIEGANACGLDLGKLVARVESPSAKGFSVQTPRATIVDLGTEFGVEVAPSGAVNTQVFRGEIQIAPAADAKRDVGSQRPTRVTAGQTAIVVGGRVTFKPADAKTFAHTRLPELRAADGSLIVYQENFNSFTVGPISGQHGWTATSGQPQIAISGTLGTDRVAAGTNSSNQGAARNLSLYSIPSPTTELIFQGRMRMRSQFGNRAGFVDRTGKVIIAFGAGYGGYNFVVVDDSDNKLFSGNATGENALSPSSHAWYDVRFTVDFNGDGKATGALAVKKDGQASFATLASGLRLRLDPRYEEPANWTGLLLAMRTASDQQDDIQLSCFTAGPASAPKAATGSLPPRGSEKSK